MKFKRQVEIVKGRPDLTALVNVVLLLVFFLLLASAFVQQPGIKIDLPQSRTPGVLPYKSVVVMLTGADEAYYRDTKMTMTQLRHLLTKESDRASEQQLVIQADERVPYKTIVEVTDMAFQAKFRAVNLATRPGLAAPSPSK
jgi:biopolymer transport protein ExbD